MLDPPITMEGASDITNIIEGDSVLTASDAISDTRSFSNDLHRRKGTPAMEDSPFKSVIDAVINFVVPPPPRPAMEGQPVMSPFKEKEINFLKENDLFPPNLKTQASFLFEGGCL